jgi:hypothetical protein
VLVCVYLYLRSQKISSTVKNRHALVTFSVTFLFGFQATEPLRVIDASRHQKNGSSGRTRDFFRKSRERKRTHTEKRKPF